MANSIEYHVIDGFLMKVDRFLLVLLLAGIFLVPLTYFYIYPLFLQKIQQPSFFSSGIYYELRLETDAPLSNATFLIPLPVRDSIPAVGFMNLREDMFEKPGYNASFVFLEGYPYLKLTADTIDTIMSREEYRVSYGDQSQREDYDSVGREVEYQNASDYPYWINTRQPLENETVFLPKYNVSIMEPIPPTYMTGSGIRYNPVTLLYQTRIYAEFDSLDALSVNIYANLEGYNTWAEEFDAWRGNSYSDSFQGSFSGSPRGWYLAEGKMKSGSGKYLDETY